MTTALAPLVRVRPAPRLEPPADDEFDRYPPTHEPLTREPLTHEPLTREPLTREPLSLTRWPDPAPALDRVPAPEPERPGKSGEAWLAAHRYLGLCAEVLGGFRPREHLRPLTSPEVYEEVLRQLARPRARGAGRDLVNGRRAAPAPGPRLVRAVAGQVTLRRVRVGEPRDGVAEAAGVFARDQVSWAAAARLERGPGGWLCTYLRVL